MTIQKHQIAPHIIIALRRMLFSNEDAALSPGPEVESEDYIKDRIQMTLPVYLHLAEREYNTTTNLAEAYFKQAKGYSKASAAAKRWYNTKLKDISKRSNSSDEQKEEQLRDILTHMDNSRTIDMSRYVQYYNEQLEYWHNLIQSLQTFSLEARTYDDVQTIDFNSKKYPINKDITILKPGWMREAPVLEEHATLAEFLVHLKGLAPCNPISSVNPAAAALMFTDDEKGLTPSEILIDACNDHAPQSVIDIVGERCPICQDGYIGISYHSPICSNLACVVGDNSFSPDEDDIHKTNDGFIIYPGQSRITIVTEYGTMDEGDIDTLVANRNVGDIIPITLLPNAGPASSEDNYRYINTREDQLRRANTPRIAPVELEATIVDVFTDRNGTRVALQYIAEGNRKYHNKFEFITKFKDAYHAYDALFGCNRPKQQTNHIRLR